MLRITVREQPDIRIILEGKLASLWVNELRTCCKNVLSHSDPRSVSVELADVSFVDTAGKELLAELSHKGVQFISDDVAMDALVEDITKGRRDDYGARAI